LLSEDEGRLLLTLLLLKYADMFLVDVGTLTLLEDAGNFLLDVAMLLL
jgi:hypothetical protein